nr:MAG TPA: Protein of unknown function (DUF2517) [Caudoviricetes sp.]
MYHYLHRLWYTKQSTIYHSWQKPQICAINCIWSLNVYLP